MLTKVFSSKKQVKYTGNTKKSNEALDMPLDEIVLVVESIKLDLDVRKSFKKGYQVFRLEYFLHYYSQY